MIFSPIYVTIQYTFDIAFQCHGIAGYPIALNPWVLTLKGIKYHVVMINITKPQKRKIIRIETCSIYRNFFSITRRNIRLITLILSLGWEMDTFYSSAVISIFLRDSVSLPPFYRITRKLTFFELNLIIEKISLNQQTFNNT